MPLDFPTSPTNGQTYNGYVYSTSVGAWQAKPAAQSPFYTSDTPPTNPVAGDSWFNTNDGTMYIYVNDGNTSQWVEHRSEIARSQVGMSPVVPTSITISGGTATVGSNGLVTLTNALTFSLNGVFSASCKNYRLFLEGKTASAVVGGDIRLRSGTTDATSADYAWFGPRSLNWNGISMNGTTGGTTWGLWDTYSGGQVSLAVADILRPFEAVETKYASMGYHYSASIGTSNYLGHHKLASSYNGLTFVNSAGVGFTGTIQILGYN